MQFANKAPAIHHAASTEKDHRLADIYLDKTGEDTGRLMATEGHIAAVYPVTLDENDKPGPIPTKAWELFLKSKMDTVEAGDTIMGMPREEDTGAYPVTGIDSFLANSDLDPDSGEIAIEIGIDAELLLRLAKAIGCHKGGKGKTAPIVMRVIAQQGEDGEYGTINAIHIRPDSGNLCGTDENAKGIIMPMRIKP